MKKAEKSLFVEDLAKELTLAKSFVLVNFKGLGVAAQQDLKKQLKAVGARMLVVKNTLLKRAGDTAKINKEILAEEILSGQTALIIGGADPIAFIQVLGEFTKDHESPKMKVGVVEGSFQDQEALIKLSTLPGKDVLLGQVLSALMSPSYGLVGVLQGNLQKLIYILKQKAG